MAHKYELVLYKVCILCIMSKHYYFAVFFLTVDSLCHVYMKIDKYLPQIFDSIITNLYLFTEINEMKDVVTKLGGRLPSSVEMPY